MNYVEKHILKQSDPRYKICLAETRKSKDLRNAALFINRQHYSSRHGGNVIEDVAEDIDNDYVSWMKVDKLLKKQNHQAYKAMLANSAQETLKMLDSEYQSYFALLSLKKQGLYNEKVRPPKYSDKDGYYPVVYNRSQLSQKNLKNGIILIPKTDVTFDDVIHIETMRQLRIVPKNGYIVIELLYRVEEECMKQDNGRYASMDPGIGTLGAIFSNVMSPLLISGGPVKSINQYYNKKLARLNTLLTQNKNTVVDHTTGEIKEQKTSKAIQRLSMKRQNKLFDYFHKASSLVVQILVSNQINTFVLGHTKGWKQSTKMKHKSNNMQNFQEVPFNKFFWMLEYKMKKAGINFYVQEESYTSKASALDGDDIPVFDKLSAEERKKVKFSGRRVRRGLYRSADKTIINADINGAANQLRKYLKGVRDADYRPTDRGLVMNPVQIKVLFQRIKPKEFLPAKSRKKQGTVVCAKNKSIKNLNKTKQI